MPLSNTTQLVSDIQEIMDNPPEGGMSAIAEAWSNALASWLVTVNSPPVEALTPDALTSVMIPILSTASLEAENFITLLDSSLIAASGVILLDPLVAASISAGTVVTPPVLPVTFIPAKGIGMAGGDSFAVATAMAAELVTWSATGTVAGASWT